MSILSHIAYSGLQSSQMAMTSTGQNIANVNTPGFSRIAPTLVSVAGQNGRSAGGGVEIASIRRLGSDFQNQQLWRANTEQNMYASAQQYLGALESLMDGDGSSISIGLDQFFAALSELTVSPESMALRQQVISEAGNLAQRFNGLSGNIDAQIRALHEQRETMVVQVNGLLENIGQLNQRIVEAKALGEDTNALLDHRESLVGELSQFASIRTTDVPDGSVTLSLANGQPLVAGATASKLQVNRLANGEQQLSLRFGKSEFPLAQDHLGGGLGGLHNVEHQSLRPMLDSLKQIAGELASSVNDTLADGFDLKGDAGKPLFAYDAGSITGLLDTTGISASELALSSVGDEVGNNDVLLDLLALRSSTITLNGNQTTLNDAYAGMLGQVAGDSRENQAELRTATTVREQAQAQRDSISAVNLDEEAVNLMTYQQAYQANMKVISTANQLFNDLMAAF